MSKIHEMEADPSESLRQKAAEHDIGTRDAFKLEDHEELDLWQRQVYN
jgi:hypothetical protein